ncbi:glycosyl transferase [Actinokineospora enzanensis]|uniref:glycosyl transferase n=1 Tax=Actinokineospora enzanensis TaxID=155975 RepID=UPI0012EB912B|nr:glycosyl transferase [Actinokineospora enzanensis]
METPDHLPLDRSAWRRVIDARALDRDILAAFALAALAAVTAVLRLGALDAPAQPGEGRGVSQIFAVDTLTTLLDTTSAPLAWLQIGGYTAATDAFARHVSALAAAREAMVIAAALTAVLLWVLALRIGLSRVTAAVAVVIAAVAPMAVGLQSGVRAENVAVPWLLLGLALLWTPRRHRRLAPDLWATAFLVIAVITAPVAIIPVGTAAWLVWRRQRRRLSLMLACLFGLGTGIGLGASAALAGLRMAAEGPSALTWPAEDPVFATAAVVAAIAALHSYRLRPLAAGVLGLAAVAAIPGGPGTSALTIAVAPAALVIAGTVERAVRHGTARATFLGRHPLRVPAIGLAVAVVLTAGPNWANGLHTVLTAHPDPAPVLGATRWLRENLPDAQLVTDSVTWADLVRGGRPARTTIRAADCVDDTCATGSWLLFTTNLRASLPHRPALADAAPRGETVAVFGAGGDRVEIHRPAIDGPGGLDEQLARTRLGGEIAADPRVSAQADADTALRAGRADPRVLTMLSALAATRPVRLAALPPVPGEDDAGQPRRQMLITAADEPAEQLAHFFTSQPGVYRPESVHTAAGAVLVRYPAGAPAGLLPTP